MNGHLRKLVDHLKWADAGVLGALQATPGADARALTLYAHVLGAEAVWLARVAGRAAAVDIWPALSLEAVTALADHNARELDALVDSLNADDLAREIEYRNSAGLSFRSTIEDILLHVALHGAYHRGQVALVMRGSGGVPASTDYIGFVRGTPAARTLPPTPVHETR